jgi:beta-lactam-binding protein with PASTA domain
VTGMTQAAVAAALTAANLTVGTIAQQTSNTVASGNVVGQDQPKGSSLAQGSPVNLVISLGPLIVAVPQSGEADSDRGEHRLQGSETHSN